MRLYKILDFYVWRTSMNDFLDNRWVRIHTYVIGDLTRITVARKMIDFRWNILIEIFYPILCILNAKERNAKKKKWRKNLDTYWEMNIVRIRGVRLCKFIFSAGYSKRRKYFNQWRQITWASSWTRKTTSLKKSNPRYFNKKCTRSIPANSNRRNGILCNIYEYLHGVMQCIFKGAPWLVQRYVMTELHPWTVYISPPLVNRVQVDGQRRISGLFLTIGCSKVHTRQQVADTSSVKVVQRKRKFRLQFFSLSRQPNWSGPRLMNT